MVKTYVDVRNEAVEQIKAAFTDKDGKCPVFVEAHPGRFDEAEIRRLAQRTPAVFTSLMGVDDEKNEFEFVSWVLARAQGKDRLYDTALGIVSALVPVIRNLDADYSTDAPHGIEAECLYSGSLDAINVTLWAVRWTWELRKSVFESGDGGFPVFELDIFEGYEAAHQIGDVNVNDTVNLEDNHGNTDGANS
ncbi:MAG: hypothetical protein LBK61_09230 [Spirochaetaceae bacterium]|nr:hypothetical protein [Spirochaetaceae bacterium]